MTSRRCCGMNRVAMHIGDWNALRYITVPHSLGPLLMLMDDRIVQAGGAHSGVWHSAGQGTELPRHGGGIIQNPEGGGHQAVTQPGRITPVNPLLFVVWGPKGWWKMGVKEGWVGSQGGHYIEEEAETRHVFDRN